MVYERELDTRNKLWCFFGEAVNDVIIYGGGGVGNPYTVRLSLGIEFLIYLEFNRVRLLVTTRRSVLRTP